MAVYCIQKSLVCYKYYFDSGGQTIDKKISVNYSKCGYTNIRAIVI